MTTATENGSGAPSTAGLPRGQAILEIALIFVLFFLHGAWPTPDVNETNYLTKAAHFWNPQAFANDFYCNSGDVQVVYFYAFGWLTTLGLSLASVAWIGRILTWLLLAIAWHGLSVSLLPRHWWSVLSAELFALLVGISTMAGEWIIGGVEAKGFSYALVFFALQALVRGRWNIAWLLAGAATALHPLVGGWTMITLGLAWVLALRGQAPLRAMLPGLLGGILLAFPGLWFAFALSANADAQTLRQSNLIQIYERVPHHLLPLAHSKGNVARHLILLVALLTLWRFVPAHEGDRRLRWFVGSTILLSLFGLLMCVVAVTVDHNSAVAAAVAGLLRFYWFRVPDIMLPLSAALAIALGLCALWPRRRSVALFWLSVACIVCVLDLANQTRHVPGLSKSARATVPRPDEPATFNDWREVGRWAAEHTPPGTLFLTPRTTYTFKWYSGRDEVVNWKDMPQDAVLFVEWRQRIGDAFDLNRDDANPRWCESLSQLGLDRLHKLAADYGAQYAVVELIPGLTDLPLKPKFENKSFAVYRIDGTAE